jgi:predicted SAM-dependent methyltransferase
MKLNLGCGNDIKKGYVNVDNIKLKGVDKVVDLEKKLPFKSNSCNEIIAYKIIEHLHNPHFFIEECYRILKKDGVLKLSAPHTSNVALAGCLVHYRS